MLFILWVLLFGVVRSAEVADELPLVKSVAPTDAEIDPVMLEIMNSDASVTNASAYEVEDQSLADIKSLVGTLTKGDANLIAFIIKQLQLLRGKTYAELEIIKKRIARKLKYKKLCVDQKDTQDKKTSKAIAAYAAEVITSKYERLQINREISALDRIMAMLNAMSNWKTCPTGWREFGKSCYRTLPNAYAYLAEGKCLAVGGSLIRVDNPDDKAAISWMGAHKNANLILGFFRSLKSGQYNYIDGEETNPASWYSWQNSYQNNKAYNYVRYLHSYRKIQGCHYSWKDGPLCEHRLAVNLGDRKANVTVASRLAQTVQKKNVLVASSFTINRQWRLSVEVYQRGKVSNWGSIVYFTQKNQNRIPALWFHPNGNQLHMCMWTARSTNDCYNSAALAMNKWHTIVMTQTVVNYNYVLTYIIDGKTVATKPQGKPQIFTKVKMYAADPWYSAFNGYTRNLKMVSL
jgi:hypothetical protein